MRQDDKTNEKVSMAATKKLSADMTAALTSDSGPLAPGQLPSVKVSSEAGAKKMMQALDDDKTTVVKRKKEKDPAKDKPSETLEPKTHLESGT